MNACYVMECSLPGEYMESYNEPYTVLWFCKKHTARRTATKFKFEVI